MLLLYYYSHNIYIILCMYQQIFILIIESTRACILCSINNVVTLSVQANDYQRVPTEMNEIPPAPPNYSEM